jgi:hypothetical protein
MGYFSRYGAALKGFNPAGIPAGELFIGRILDKLTAI